MLNHKYKGKEFDTTHSLNTYDYGARLYNLLVSNRNMKRLLYVLFLSVAISCSIRHDDFFDTISVKNVRQINIDTIEYITEYMDFHFPEIGTHSLPVFKNSIKFDTLLQYRVRFVGGAVFRTDSVEDGYKIIDSVYVSAVHVNYKDNNHVSYTKQDYNNWKDCPIPISIILKLREDFYLRMKYQKYQLKLPISRKVTGAYSYSLY